MANWFALLGRPEPDPEPPGWDDEGNLPAYPLDDGAVEYDEHTVPQPDDFKTVYVTRSQMRGRMMAMHAFCYPEDGCLWEGHVWN